ncbi:hypothetical protein GQ55_2G458600 [Panicum hallii var. hallii]|uniref:Uncharacterized protein n=1 Tax=Panicum hallii var. hallii TaxID=1504633 RepID=A0A2T7EZI3_9POAL|nr:hypothetical protein GQ55_2G458600 [Panicum hallii var. hallii]
MNHITICLEFLTCGDKFCRIVVCRGLAVFIRAKAREQVPSDSEAELGMLPACRRRDPRGATARLNAGMGIDREVQGVLLVVELLTQMVGSCRSTPQRGQHATVQGSKGSCMARRRVGAKAGATGAAGPRARVHAAGRPAEVAPCAWRS